MKKLFEEENAITVKVTDLCLIYFLLRNGEVVYVGKTTKGLYRPFCHTDKDFDTVKVIQVKMNELDVMEDFYIKKYNPCYNKDINHNANFTLQRTKKELKKIIGCRVSIQSIKKAIKALDIEPFCFNGGQYIEYANFLRILNYMKGEEYGNKKNC